MVKWKGYPDHESSWEPERNLENAQEAIAQYETSIGELKNHETTGFRAVGSSEEIAMITQAAEPFKTNWVGIRRQHKENFNSVTENSRIENSRSESIHSNMPARRQESMQRQGPRGRQEPERRRPGQRQEPGRRQARRRQEPRRQEPEHSRGRDTESSAECLGLASLRRTVTARSRTEHSPSSWEEARQREKMDRRQREAGSLIRRERKHLREGKADVAPPSRRAVHQTAPEHGSHSPSRRHRTADRRREQPREQQPERKRVRDNTNVTPTAKKRAVRQTATQESQGDGAIIVAPPSKRADHRPASTPAPRSPDAPQPRKEQQEGRKHVHEGNADVSAHQTATAQTPNGDGSVVAPPSKRADHRTATPTEDIYSGLRPLSEEQYGQRTRREGEAQRDPDAEYRRLFASKSGKTFELRNVPGDGDCFYHTIIRELQLKESIQQLRMRIADYGSHGRGSKILEKITDMLGDNPRSVLRRIRTKGKDADNCDVTLLAYLGVHLHIYHSGDKAVWTNSQEMVKLLGITPGPVSGNVISILHHRMLDTHHQTGSEDRPPNQPNLKLYENFQPRLDINDKGPINLKIDENFQPRLDINDTNNFTRITTEQARRPKDRSSRYFFFIYQSLQPWELKLGGEE